MQDNSRHARFRRSVKKYRQLLIDNYYRSMGDEFDVEDFKRKIFTYYILCKNEYSETELLFFILRTMSTLIEPRDNYSGDPCTLNMIVTQKAHELIDMLEV